MAPYQFGIKVAADLTRGLAAPSVPAAPAIPKTQPKAQPQRTAPLAAHVLNHPADWTNPAAQAASRAALAQRQQNRPAPAPPKPYVPPAPATTQRAQALTRQYPQLGQGDVNDILAMEAQKRPQADIDTFTRNTLANTRNYAQPR